MYRCRYLSHGLYISLYDLKHCHLSMHAHDERENNSITPYFGPDKSTVNWEELFEKKRKLVTDMRNGKIPSFCQGCHWIEEFDENSDNQFLTDLDNYIDIIWIGNFTECNSRCMYCASFPAITQNNMTKDYGVIRLLKEMLEKKIYDVSKEPDSSISFSQGEPTLLQNFDEIIKLFEQYGSKNVWLYTNGIKHSPMVEKSFRNRKKTGNNIRVIISLDAGSREVFKKVKMVDKFNDVVKTIKRYVRALDKDNKKAVAVKYIIVPKINDSKEEIDKFFNLCVKKLGVRHLIADLEENYFIRHNGEVPEYLKDLLRYFRDKCEENDIFYQFFDRASVTKI